MKKQLLVTVLFLVLFIGCAPIKMVTEIKYETLLEMPGKSKSELYGMSNEWMVEQFIDARSIIQFSNLETGTIAGKYLLFYQAPSGSIMELSFYSIITIRVKDYRVQIIVDPQGSLPRNPLGMELYTMKQLEDESNRLISSYESFMKAYVKF